MGNIIDENDEDIERKLEDSKTDKSLINAFKISSSLGALLHISLTLLEPETFRTQNQKTGEVIVDNLPYLKHLGENAEEIVGTLLHTTAAAAGGAIVVGISLSLVAAAIAARERFLESREGKQAIKNHENPSETRKQKLRDLEDDEKNQGNQR